MKKQNKHTNSTVLNSKSKDIVSVVANCSITDRTNEHPVAKFRRLEIPPIAIDGINDGIFIIFSGFIRIIGFFVSLSIFSYPMKYRLRFSNGRRLAVESRMSIL